ncbi:hypothetical protein LAZ67_15001703 [Cordylochernes scorpioides]|uniref:Uncharacterized protein n=1 Tax=Cordylochernes scorpioides TaxID=51811 RepID=A0ABY6L8Y6_9ARAC|nr:hypothetical protein LAZ67_15001703 [Cordylochernes scorpioides]
MTLSGRTTNIDHVVVKGKWRCHLGAGLERRNLVLYLRDGSGQNAQRIACKRILKCVGGSTKGLHVHQKAVHGIETSKRNVKDEVDTQTPAKKTPKISILDHFSSVSIDRSTDAVLARMIALDGLPFSVFVTSKDLRKCSMLLDMKFLSPQRPLRLKSVVMRTHS